MRVDILCPAGSISGGPEALHQFCGALRDRGVDAAMVYYGGTGVSRVPPQYTYCRAAVRNKAADDPETVIVVPEVATSLIWRFPAARKVIWWLSVDNYFKWQHLNPGPSVLTPRQDVMHLCQSHYASEFLVRAGASPVLMVSDYLTPGSFPLGAAGGRVPAIAYNPRRSSDMQQQLLAAPGGRAWVALEGLDKPSLAQLLRQVRLYVDFGQHPGRDRLPREAAASGAVIITGRRGAAGFDNDLPLPVRFRLDEGDPGFQPRALALIDSLLASDTHFLQAWEDQRSYRAWIDSNAAAFAAEVDAFLAALAEASCTPA